MGKSINGQPALVSISSRQCRCSASCWNAGFHIVACESPTSGHRRRRGGIARRALRLSDLPTDCACSRRGTGRYVRLPRRQAAGSGSTGRL